VAVPRGNFDLHRPVPSPQVSALPHTYTHKSRKSRPCPAPKPIAPSLNSRVIRLTQRVHAKQNILAAPPSTLKRKTSARHAHAFLSQWKNHTAHVNSRV
jgi:hypothetical protein